MDAADARSRENHGVGPLLARKNARTAACSVRSSCAACAAADCCSPARSSARTTAEPDHPAVTCDVNQGVCGIDMRATRDAGRPCSLLRYQRVALGERSPTRSSPAPGSSNEISGVQPSFSRALLDLPAVFPPPRDGNNADRRVRSCGRCRGRARSPRSLCPAIRCPSPSSLPAQHHEIAHRVLLAGSHDEILRLGLLQHQPLRAHIVARVAPVASASRLPRCSVSCRPRECASRPRVILRETKVSPAQRRFVVEENAVAREQPVGLAIIHADPMRVELGNTVR